MIYMDYDLSSLHKQIRRDQAARDYTRKLLATHETTAEDLEEKQENLSMARELFIKAAKETQQKLEYHISGLVTTALNAVFDLPYQFQLEFVERRGKTEADLWFVANGEKIKPIDATGGGAVDIASLALRIAFWSLTKKSRPLFVWDEPLRMLSKDLMPKAAEMLRSLSQNLGLQILMVTHSDELAAAADKTYEVELIKGKSRISQNGDTGVVLRRRHKI